MQQNCDDYPFKFRSRAGIVRFMELTEFGNLSIATALAMTSDITDDAQRAPLAPMAMPNVIGGSGAFSPVMRSFGEC